MLEKIWTWGGENETGKTSLQVVLEKGQVKHLPTMVETSSQADASYSLGSGIRAKERSLVSAEPRQQRELQLEITRRIRRLENKERAKYRNPDYQLPSWACYGPMPRLVVATKHSE